MSKKSAKKNIVKSAISEMNSSEKQNDLEQSAVSKLENDSDFDQVATTQEDLFTKENSEHSTIVSKRKVQANQPSTSQGQATKEENEPVSKKICMEYNFWEEHQDIATNVLNEADEFLKINELQTGNYCKKQLNVRITYISSIRTTSVGNVLNFHGMDNSGEIYMTAFGKNTSNIAKFLKINCLFSIRNFYVKEEDSNYQSGTGNALQIHIRSNTEVEALDDNDDFPRIFFNFTPLENVQTLNKNQKIDTLGILVKNNGLDKNYKGTIMRDLSLTDTTKTMVTVTLWTENAKNFAIPNFSVIVIRKGSITEHEGRKKINCINGTLLWGDSNLPEAIKLKEEFLKMIKKTE